MVWDRAEGFQVCDPYGNCWIDWSSGVLITNAGHGRAEIIEAIQKQAASKLLTNYCFPSEIRAHLVERLATIMPEPLKKVFLLTTGSEAVECAIKLCRTHGVKVGGRSKHVIVSFDKAFHGRTLGSQQAGGIPALKEWIVNLDQRLRAGAVSRRLPHAGHELRFLPEGAARRRRRGAARRGRDSRNVSGRQRRLRARRVHEGASQVVRRAQGAAGLRRGPGRLRPHRHAVGLRALRDRSRPGDLRQGHLEFDAACPR